MIALRTLVFASFVTLSSLGSAAPAGFEPVRLDPSKLKLQSANVLVLDPESGESIYAKSPNDVQPIASITKLMTAMVVLDSKPDMDEMIAIDVDDLDYLKGTRSRLGMGYELSRRELLQLALMSSENRAASALARSYPGGSPAFIAAMNAKAAALGMTHTHFEDPTGLTPHNVSTANELAIMVKAAAEYPTIREFTTTPSHFVEVQPTGRVLGFNNSNRLVSSSTWDILLQKTGFINEAGRCLVMMAQIASRPVVIVLLDSVGKYTRLGDAARVKYWLETGNTMPSSKVAAVTKAPAKAKATKAKAPAKKTGVKGTLNGKYASASSTRTN
ncbi:MAG: D-alanyl-D-alanine endopeptidase [Proteobacteria bacterium]|nr:D-alanyl-D-alanine endopeptidase [Pseudomonadota bacterium]